MTRIGAALGALAIRQQTRTETPRMRERYLSLAPAHRALLVALVFTLTLLSTTSAYAISRDTALSRAQSWIDAPVPYSQSRYHLGYRTDCSGYVSMCWATRTSWTTRSFYHVTHRVTTRELKPGDALLKKGYHIRLFYGWVDAAHTNYVAYEAGNAVGVSRIHAIADDLHSGYVPTRYNRITNSPAPRNILRNGAFNVWARTWDQRSAQPVWWQVSGPPWQTLVVHRTNVYRSAHSSLQLMNPSMDPARYVEMSQSASVVPSATYQLGAWARSIAASSGIEMKITCLDSAGNSLSETSTTGDAWKINNSAFRPMWIKFVTPPSAVTALVTFRLAGGITMGANGALAGTRVLLDDVSVIRPQATIGITRNVSSTGIGGAVVLRGSVTPTAAIGRTVAVYMLRPGGVWAVQSNQTVVATSTGAKWQYKLAFTRGMRKGVYHFKAKIAGFPGYLGATSRVLTFTLR